VTCAAAVVASLPANSPDGVERECCASRDVQAHGTGRLHPCISHANHDSLRSAHSIWCAASHHACSPRQRSASGANPTVRIQSGHLPIPSIQPILPMPSVLDDVATAPGLAASFVCVTTDGKHQGDLAVSPADPSHYRRDLAAQDSLGTPVIQRVRSTVVHRGQSRRPRGLQAMRTVSPWARLLSHCCQAQ
jgi:hypothetical protein